MGKIITAPGYCSSKHKHMGFQFIDKGGKAALGGTYGISGDSAVFSSEQLPDDISVDSNYKGCKLCGNKYAFRCGNCKMVFCYDGSPIRNFKCPECGAQFDVPAHDGAKIPTCKRSFKAPKIFVTSSNYDNIGAVLSKMNLHFEPFSGNFDCDILAINCGTRDSVDPVRLRNFIQGGGCVYVSDLACSILSDAVPDCFSVAKNGTMCKINAKVLDDELVQFVGSTIRIEFDLPGWAVIRRHKNAQVLLKGAVGSLYPVPIMLCIKYGEGTIYYTSFHNHAQASDKETALLKLLLLKQVGTATGSSIEDAGTALGVDMQGIRRTFRG